MAYTTTDLEAIERAIATGARIVEYADRKVEYRSIGELIRARDEIRAGLAPRNVPLVRAWTAVQDGRNTA